MADFTKAAKRDDIPADTLKQVHVAGKTVCIGNVDGEYFAIDDTCSHAQCSLAGGFLDGSDVICPCHGATFDITTGKNLSLPAPEPVAVYQVKVEGDDIYIAV